MEETTIIIGKTYNIKKIIFIISIIISTIGLIAYTNISNECYKDDLILWCENKRYSYSYIGALSSCDEGFASYWIRNLFFSQYGIMLAATLIPLGIVIFLLIIYFWLKSMEIVVSNKRVYGKTAFGKMINLPLDSISAVEVSWLKGISISTSSGKIKFKLIKNYQEVYKEVSELLMKRQTEIPNTNNEINTNYIDELKKLKELLDLGAITQEEYDIKKSQLLNTGSNM